jgi:hypothetical protein
MHSVFTGWSRPSQIAAAAAGALMCLLIGALIGITAAGGHARGVLNVFTDQAATADANTHKPPTAHNHTVTVTEPAQSPTSTAGGVSRPPATVTVTVTQPPATVTETDTVTETQTTPPATSSASSP